MKIRFKAMEYILVVMGANTMAIGLITKCKEVVLTLGLMVTNIQASMRITKSITMGYIVTQMGANTKDSGKMESNMVMGDSRLQME